MQIRSFRDLRVWQAGIDLVRQVYELTSKLPRSEVYGLASQMQRAAVSIPSNIAEGHARESTKDFFSICPLLKLLLQNWKLKWRSGNN